MEVKSNIDNPILRIKNIAVHFNGIIALSNVTFDVHQKELVSIIGPNGAGKTTLLNCLSRIYEPKQGDIIYKGKSLLGKAPHTLAALGINRTFQRVTLFHSMTVLDNIKVGMHSHSKSGFISSALRLPFARQEEQKIHTAALKMAAKFKLQDVINTPVRDLSIVMQKRVELARALMGSPELLLLDEPASGLSHLEVEEHKTLINSLRNKGITILVVEHNMNFVMNISDRIVVLNFGTKIAQGTPAQIQQNPEVIRAYLGDGK